jgi:MinD-like ATPase involved in chromosome partitioning or flagellar assembly
LSILSGTRSFHEIDAGAVAAVVDAGRRGGATVVCDIPRQLSAAAICALQFADLVVVVTSCDVRAIAATTAMLGILRSVNPAVGLVVRGPSPGGLVAREVADAAEAPLLAAMRPEPMLAQRLEQGGLRLRRRSPLTRAAGTVLDVVHRNRGRAA